MKKLSKRITEEKTSIKMTTLRNNAKTFLSEYMKKNDELLKRLV